MALSALLDQLVAFARRYVVLTMSQAVAWALWVVHTHALDAAEQTPYLSITAPEKRSGKTRLLEVSELVVARPWLTGRVSAAALVRKVDKVCPTLLLDESDAAFNSDKEYAEALRGILNSGHRANGKASLCVGQGAGLDFRDFSTFCPKAIAGIGKLPDTVADRAIPIRLRRKAKGEQVERFRDRRARTEAEPLRDWIEAWAQRSIETLRLAEPHLPEELSDRQQDGVEPLLGIADLAGGDWPERSRRALVELFGADLSEDDSLGVRLLRDCRAVFDANGVDRLSSSDLCAALIALEEGPWSEFQKGKPLTLRGLAGLLRSFEIVSRSIRLDDGATPKGYHRASFEDAWSRYDPSPMDLPNATAPQTNTGAGFRDSPIRHTAEVVADEKGEIVHIDGPCGGVADERTIPEPDSPKTHVAATRNQCGSCLAWRPSSLVQLDRLSRIYLCEECGANQRSLPACKDRD